MVLPEYGSLTSPKIPARPCGGPDVDSARPRNRTRSILSAIALSIIALTPVTAPAEPPDAPDALTALQSRFESVAQKVAPTVVAISASVTADTSPSCGRVEEMSPDTLAAFLSKTTRMVGTGFVISSDGYVLTNDHVIDEGQQYWITTDGGTVYPAIVVGSDPRADLAVLKVPAHDLPAVKLDATVPVARGQWAIAIGNPFGLSGSGEMCLSVGVVSATHRSLPKLSEKQNRLYGDLIQTTAQINPGNSGGPLFDLDGHVIGVNSAVIMPQTSATNGIGFALPVDDRLVRVVDRLEHGRPVAYGYLGVLVSTPSELERRQAGAPEQCGVRVDTVQPQSPADGLLLPNDLILSINRSSVADSAGFGRAIADAPVDHTVVIRLLRRGKSMAVCVSLRRRPLPATAIDFSNQQLQWAGLTVANAAAADGPGLRVIAVRPDSPFFKQGVREGVIIRSIDSHAVENVVAMQTLINDTPLERCEVGFDADLRTAALSLDR